jgi:hypothetical protein
VQTRSKAQSAKVNNSKEEVDKDTGKQVSPAEAKKAKKVQSDETKSKKGRKGCTSALHENEIVVACEVAQACKAMLEVNMPQANVIVVDAKSTSYKWTAGKLRELQDQLRDEKGKCTPLFLVQPKQ